SRESFVARDREATSLPFLRVAGIAARHRPFFQLFPVDWIDDAGAARKGAKNTEHVASGPRELFDGARVIGIILVLDRSDPGENSVADTGSGASVAFALDDEHLGGGPMLLVPIRGAADEVAILVARHDLDDRDRRQHSWPFELASVAC